MERKMALNGKSCFDKLEMIGSGTSFVTEIGDMLERADMFRDMARAEVDVFARYVQAYNAPVGAEVLLEGDRESCMFVVAEGKLDILKQTDEASGIKKKIATVRSGKTIGEMSLLDGMPHSATAVVVDPAILLLITKSHFDRLLKEQPEVALSVVYKMAMLMSLRLRQTSGVLIDYLKD